jgi:hypothetical protein
MKFNGYKPSAYSFSSTAAAAHGNALPSLAADIKSPNYARRRQQRLAERLRNAGAYPPARRNRLITIVVCSSDDDDIAALPRTLGSLLAQRYRNFEVLAVGKPNVRPSDTGDFTSCRGLFAEPDVDALDVLTDSSTDSLWRGSHLILVHTGTEFDPDAIELLNAALDNLPDTTAPALVLCEDHRLSGDSDVCPSAGLPDLDHNVMRSIDKHRTAFMVSRTLLQLARRAQQRPISPQAWLRGIAALIPGPHIVHIAEPLIQIPPEPRLPSRPASGNAT